jgi:hypothetical protein
MENKSSQKEAIMAANNLKYVFDDILNVSVNRTAKKQYLDTRSYTMDGSGQAVSTWNSGVDLIDLRNSYLKFDVTLTATAAGRTYTFGTGSAMNLIKEVKILSSSGIELARTQDANIFHKFFARSTKSADWISTVGANMGFQTNTQVGNGTYVFTQGTAKRVIIPLCELDPFFNLYDNKLLPANIASGMRVEITWENLATAFFREAAGNGTEAAGYTVTNIEFRTEAVTLADSAMAILNKEASTNGLEVTYDRVYTTSTNTGTALTENVEVRKAVSLCKNVFGVTLLTNNRASLALDSFKAADYSHTSADVRLGNQYYPFQPIENVEEAYFNYLKNFNKIKLYHSESDTTLADFSNVADGNSSQGMIIANFETDDSLNLTGLPVNSSRIAELRFTRSAGDDVKTYVFMTYTALCRASLSNTSVKI